MRRAAAPAGYKEVKAFNRVETAASLGIQLTAVLVQEQVLHELVHART